MMSRFVKFYSINSRGPPRPERGLVHVPFRLRLHESRHLAPVDAAEADVGLRGRVLQCRRRCRRWLLEACGDHAAPRKVGPALDAELAARLLEGRHREAERRSGDRQRVVAECLESLERDADRLRLAVLPRLAALEDPCTPCISCGSWDANSGKNPANFIFFMGIFSKTCMS
jgi:hypothetical protein